MSEEEKAVPTPEARVEPMEEVACLDCGALFMRVQRWRGRRKGFCDPCSTPEAARKRLKMLKQNKRIVDMDRAQDEIPKIIDAMVENPGITPKQMSAYLDIPTLRIMHYLSTNLALNELRRHASNKITEMIPKAIRAIDQIVQNKKHSDRFKAATEILKSERVLGPERVDVSVSVEKKSIKELQAIIAEAAKIPEPVVIETELISDTPNS